MNDENLIDSIINRLLSSKDTINIHHLLKKKEILWLINKIKIIFESQPVFLELIPPLTICGDIHGQFRDLLRLFEINKYPDDINYLFLGDYVDRGESSINTICLLFAYKIKYPKNIFLLRGNHECREINRIYGFYDECVKIHGNSDIWEKFNDCFEWMPISALIDSRILCIHGGISPNLVSIEQLKEIERPNSVPDDTLISDILWSDPDSKISTFIESDRGLSFIFGEEPLKKFLNNNNLDLIVRAHQVIDAGFDFPFSPNYNIVTVFSAPNYCGDCNNKGSIMHVDIFLKCSFTKILPNSKDNIPKLRPMSPPSKPEHDQPEEINI